MDKFKGISEKKLKDNSKAIYVRFLQLGKKILLNNIENFMKTI